MIWIVGNKGDKGNFRMVVKGYFMTVIVLVGLD